MHNNFPRVEVIQIGMFISNNHANMERQISNPKDIGLILLYLLLLHLPVIEKNLWKTQIFAKKYVPLII